MRRPANVTSPIHVTINTNGFRSCDCIFDEMSGKAIYGFKSCDCIFDEASGKAIDGRAWLDYFDFDNVVMLRFPIFISSWWNKKRYTGKEMVFTSWHRVAAMRLQMIQPVYGEETEIELIDR